METIIYRLQDVLINYDYLRKPLSSMERKNFQGEYPYYGAQGIIDYVQEYRCDGEFLLIAEDGENLMSRNQPLALIVNGKFWVNNHAHIVKTNDLADMYYTCYALNHLDITGFVTGSAQPKLSQGNLNKIKIQFPPIEYQKRIVSVLSTYDSLIEVNNKRIKVLEQMAENLYKEWFVRFRFPGHETNEFENDIPKEWNISRVCEIGEVVGGGTPSTDRPEFWSGSIPWLSPADLASFENVFISSGESFITEEGMKQSSTKLLPKNTVLLSSRAPIGYVAIAKNEICTNQGFKSVICDPEKVSPFYLFYFFKNNKDLLECFASGSTFLELSGGRLKKIKLVVPPIDIQNKFARIIEPWLNQTELLIEENNNLIKQRDLLLPRLMSGKLEVKKY